MHTTCVAHTVLQIAGVRLLYICPCNAHTARRVAITVVCLPRQQGALAQLAAVRDAGSRSIGEVVPYMANAANLDALLDRPLTTILCSLTLVMRIWTSGRSWDKRVLLGCLLQTLVHLVQAVDFYVTLTKTGKSDALGSSGRSWD